MIELRVRRRGWKLPWSGTLRKKEKKKKEKKNEINKRFHMRPVILEREKKREFYQYFKFRVFETSSFVPWKPRFFAWSIIKRFDVGLKKERRENIYSIHAYIHTYTHTHTYNVHTRTITMILINVNGFSLLYYRCYLIIYLQIIKRESVVVLFANLDCPSKFFSLIYHPFSFLSLCGNWEWE